MITTTGRWAIVVLRSPLQTAIAILVAASTLLFAVWLPNLGLVWNEAVTSSLSPVHRMGFLASMLGALTTTASPVQVATTATLAALVGLNVAGTVALLRSRSGSGGAGAGLAGATVGLLGVGCSACGVGILSSLLGAGTAASVLAALPLGGLEFSLAGIALLVAAFAVSARRALTPRACDVESADG